MDFDRVSRHVWSDRILRTLLPDGGSVLDVGGSEGLTSDHLHGYEVVVVDVEQRGDVDVIGSGTALPFRDRSFDGVVALDVLEHIPEHHRSPFLGELARVAAEVVIVGGPYKTEGVADAEGSVRPIFEGLFEQDHPWLAEHAEFGLPDLKLTSQIFEDSGWNVKLHQSNPLPLWRELQVANFLAARVGDSKNLQDLHDELLKRFIDAGDGRGPAYRHFVVAARDEVLLPDSDDVEQDEVEAWIRRTLRVQGEVVDAAMKRLGDYVDDLRSSAESAKAGWEEAAAEVERMRGSVSAAEEGWRESVESFRQAEQRLSYEELTREALESQLVQSPESWMSQVKGPPIARRGPDVPYEEEYRRWSRRNNRAPATATRDTSIKFSVLTPVYNPTAESLTACIRSVRSQTYPNWELILVDVSDASHIAPICDRFTEIDPRIRIVRTDNLGISANTNLGADEAGGDWFVLLDHDDELASHALSWLAAAISEHPDARFIYSDEDKIDEQGKRSDPFFKPDWSPDLLRHVNYVTHVQALHRDLWVQIGGLRSAYDGAQDYDLALRASWQAGGALHIPDVLYHWRVHGESTAKDVLLKPGAHRAGRRALDDFVLEHLPGSWVEFGTGPTSHRVRYPVAGQLVSVVIPFQDGWRLTESCLRGIARHGSELPFEVLLVDNRSKEKETQRKLAEWTERFPWARTLSYDEPFNFQKLNNWAVQHARGELLLFLNNDIEPIHAGWIGALAEHAQRPEVGAVGARLFYPDGLIQHAGVAVGIGGYADHPWAGLDPRSWTPAGPSFWTRNYLAVTAACLMVERSKFEAMGGFDERFTIGGGDVALGIALHDAGYWNVYTPFARLIHHESVTRGTAVPESDLGVSRQVYARFLEGRDPFYNPNLSLSDTRCRVRTGIRRRAVAAAID